MRSSYATVTWDAETDVERQRTVNELMIRGRGENTMVQFRSHKRSNSSSFLRHNTIIYCRLLHS